MIRRIIQQNSSLIHYKFIRSISGVSNLAINFSSSKQNEDISEEILASKQMAMAREIGDGNLPNRLLSQITLKHTFKQFLHCTEDEANKMMKENKRLANAEPNKISDMIQFLFENEISIHSIVSNPWLLSMNKDYLLKKLVRLRLLKPKKINDFVPLLQVSYLTLNRLMRIIHKERNAPEGNRIYYLSMRLDVDPALVSKYIATHTFMFEINFEMFVENLNVLLEYEIEPVNILKDMWAFKYYPKSIRDRLERCRTAGKDNLRPWMVRCPEEVLENSLKITQENKNLLGDLNLIEYISQRLQYDTEIVRSMIDRHPSILKCRGKKVEKVLDYLLIEEKFAPIEILRVLRVLVHSLETTKQRLKELRAIGCRPSTLTIVCRSQNEYKKFVKTWLQRRE